MNNQTDLQPHWHIPKIAVILPIAYRGGTLRAAKLVANAIQAGSLAAGEPATVVFAHPDDPSSYPDESFTDLAPSISRRPFQWLYLNRDAARRALLYAGCSRAVLHERYAVPADGINYFNDCDLWVIISDRLEAPLLPIKPYVLVVYDYIQRYQHIMPAGADDTYIDAARTADAVLATTRFTHGDITQYAGVDPQRTRVVPMLCPAPPAVPQLPSSGSNYFVWPTNPALHKNHLNAIKALQIYYTALDGRLECRITGTSSTAVLAGSFPHLQRVREIAASSSLRRHLKSLGELPDAEYFRQIANTHFVWHPGLIDNGTFCVVEAAALGVPSLSSDYPAMREMDEQFALNLQWCDPHDPHDMAVQLKEMERSAHERRTLLPSRETFDEPHRERAAPAYWNAVRDCLR